MIIDFFVGEGKVGEVEHSAVYIVDEYLWVCLVVWPFSSDFELLLYKCPSMLNLGRGKFPKIDIISRMVNKVFQNFLSFLYAYITS